MGFTEWADKHGVQSPSVPLGRWLREHPDIAAEAVAAWRGGYESAVILRWLSEEHGLSVDWDTLRRRLGEWERAQ